MFRGKNGVESGIFSHISIRKSYQNLTAVQMLLNYKGAFVKTVAMIMIHKIMIIEDGNAQIIWNI